MAALISYKFITKQEIIKQAYGEYWDKVCEYVDESGWCDWSKVFPVSCNFRIFDVDGAEKWRPKSLQSIENNNGWIKIENEADLPKKDCDLWVLSGGKPYFYSDFQSNHPLCHSYVFNNFTHYKIVEKPEPPIY